MASLSERFVRVNSDFPCPVCGRPDWCLVSRDGKKAICQRQESDIPVSRYDEIGYIHFIDQIPPGEIPKQSLSPKIDPALIEEEVARYAIFAVRGWCRGVARDMGVSPYAIEDLDFGWSPENNSLAVPMRDGRFNVVGVQYRRGEKKWMMAGGRAGLFIPHSVVTQKPSLLVISEGVSDCAAALSMGLSSIGRAACRSGKEFVKDFLSWNPLANRIIIAADSDPCGLTGAKRLAKFIKTPENKVAVIRPRLLKDLRETYEVGCTKHDLLSAVCGSKNFFWELVRDD